MQRTDDVKLDGLSDLNHAYALHFNAIDLSDRYLSKIRCQVRSENWKTKYMFMFLGQGMINLWTVVRSTSYIKFRVFAERFLNMMAIHIVQTLPSGQRKKRHLDYLPAKDAPAKRRKLNEPQESRMVRDKMSEPKLNTPYPSSDIPFRFRNNQ